MTDKPAPKEIDDLVYELRQAGKDDTYSLARAVLAKWGQPAPATQQAGEVRRAELVPGVMHCAKCKFQLNRVTLCVSDGNAYAGNNKTEPCPNGCGPLWPVTWEQEAKNCWKALEERHERLMAAAAPQPSPTAQAADSQPAQVMGDTPPPCDQELFDQGVSVGLFDIPKWTAEALCRGIAAATEARVDWHYIGGRVHIKALPAARAPADSVPAVCEVAERYRNAIASACEGWTMPDGLRKHLETALWSPPTQTQQGEKQ